VLHLTIRKNEVDVNVHPTKTEVKFRNDQQVFTTVYHAVLAALTGDRSRPQAVLPNVKKEDTVTPNQTVLTMRDATAPKVQPVQKAQPAPAPKPVSRPVPPPPRLAVAPAQEPPRKEEFTFRRAEVLPKEEPKKEPAPAPVFTEEPKPVPAPKKPEPAPAPAPQPVPAPEPEPATEPEEAWVIKGELFNTYIMVEQGEKVILIDKHAAHERANFDRLKAENYEPMVQELLLPVTFTPAPDEREILLEQAELLARFGFDVEEFGNALAVRAVPDYLDTGDVEAALLELARRIRVTGSADPKTARDELLHTMACKAAIKGGQKNGRAELEEVAELVMSGAVKYCPHGRPVAIEMTKYQLEKQFKRA